MDTKTVETFGVMNTEFLEVVIGGGNVEEIANTAGSAIAGGIIGYGICTSSVVMAPFAAACAYAGAKFGAAAYIILRFS